MRLKIINFIFNSKKQLLATKVKTLRLFNVFLRFEILISLSPELKIGNDYGGLCSSSVSQGGVCRKKLSTSQMDKCECKCLSVWVFM